MRCLLVGLFVVAGTCLSEDWSRFRGPNASGVALKSDAPSEFTPEKNVVWRTSVPAGKSSPILTEKQIFLTAHDGDRLFTIAYDRKTGKELWRREVVRQSARTRHALNDAAAATPATDGKNIYAFFPDFGLVAYTTKGKERWRFPLSDLDSMHGVSASPLLSDGLLVQACDRTAGAFLLAVDAASGKERWRQERPTGALGVYSTPAVLRRTDGKVQIVTPGPGDVTGYSLSDGKPVWWVKGLPYQPKSSPSVDAGVVYFAVRGMGGEGGPPQMPPFESFVKFLDKNADGKVTKEEMLGPMQQNFGALDQNQNGHIDFEDFEKLRVLVAAEHALVAIRPDGAGDLTSSAVLWKHNKNIPEVPSVLHYGNLVYLVQNGGILTSISDRDGKVVKQDRLKAALGDYYASPVAAAGKVFVANKDGKITVIRAGEDWSVIAVNDLKEEVFATPAISNDRLYVRTASTLYCFGSSRK